jgi:hypothetical protein
VSARLRLARRRPPPLPWRRPRHELLLIALVAVATLTPLYPINAQDVARVCLTRSVVHGHLYNDECLGTGFAVDRSAYKGHYYSDKAPGMSALEIPGVELVQLPNVTEWPLYFRKLWVVRVLAGGLAFVGGLFLLGRLSEGLAPGYGGAAIVTYGLGTLVAPLAGANFEHVTAGTLGLAAFALAWSRRALAAGLVAGAALLVAYDAAIILAVVGVYVLAQGGFALLKYVYGVLPGAALLWTYNWLAFGAPWHMSYTYKVGEAADRQTTGFFGVHIPYLHAIRLVFASESGLLVISPVVLAAGYGLVLFARRYLAEGLVCGVIAFAFLFLNCGYIYPLGGVSPGPRYLVPGLPFLALGLAPAFARRFWLTAGLASISVVAMTAVTLTWANGPPGGTIWAWIVHLPLDGGTSSLVHGLVENIVTWAGPGKRWGAALVALSALGALVVALVGARAREPRAAAAAVGDQPSAA